LMGGNLVTGPIDTGSGSVSMQRGYVTGDIDTGSGNINLTQTAVARDVICSSCDLRLLGTDVQGDVTIRELKCGWLSWGCESDRQIVQIGAGTIIRGTLRINREVQLQIDPSAKIARIENNSSSVVPKYAPLAELPRFPAAPAIRMPSEGKR
jgi:hypothetical protein